MKCDDFSLRLDDYLDGRLADDATHVVREHLAVCDACARELAAVTAFRDAVAELPQSIEPPRDLWPGIAERIDANTVVRGRFGRRALMAAAAALVVAASVVMAYLVGRQQATTEALRPPTLQSPYSDVVLASFEGLGVHDSAATRQELVDVLQARKGELSPETLDIVMSNLQLIDEAMATIAAALGDDPGNELLQRQLVSTYRRQIALLERAALLPSEV
jgi:anti-sigma factor RsiW